ncbi:MAG: 16S rRNA (cytosine(1402)-N(4))-methyltransferase RsmH [Sphingobacteriales bacterium]|nr:MAG: 16S rRNA (cytosine(1402)-N(4))-methyltransferase RsmH [Sphingobacteriales bacterium]
MSAPTPFYHTTVLLQEATNALAIRPDGVYVDATFGGGGHSRRILEQLGPSGKLIAFDQDADAWRNTPEDSRLIQVPENFRYLKRFLRLHGVPKVDGILADLGVSSWQFDTGERGFSTRFDGPLDMRMDQRGGATAAQIIKDFPEADLHQMFEQYGEVRNARQLARHLVSVRQKSPLTTVQDLRAAVSPVIKGRPDKYFAQLFQALRIEVNEELAVLKEFLQQTPDCLHPGGRLSVISFHSLEDRLVKRFIRWGRFEEQSLEAQLSPLPEAPAPLKAVYAKPIEPTEAELHQNPRSRSARLRVAERIDA